MTDKPFPEAVAELLQEQEVSQRELARRTRQAHKKGLAVSTINYYISGDLRPSPDSMKRVATALHVQAEHFAEYRLAVARRNLDPEVVGLRAALRNLG